MPSRWSGNSSLGLTVRCDSTRDHGPHTPPMHPTSEHVHAGGLDVGLEPSCTAVFRSDEPELVPEDRDIARLRDQTVTLSELLLDHTPGWLPTTVPGDVHALAQVHRVTSTRSPAGTRTRNCWPVPACRSSGCLPDAAGWPATSDSNAATWTSAGPAPNRYYFSHYARPTRIRQCSPMDSAAEPRFTSCPTATASTWPSCSRPFLIRTPRLIGRPPSDRQSRRGGRASPRRPHPLS